MKSISIKYIVVIFVLFFLYNIIYIFSVQEGLINKNEIDDLMTSPAKSFCKKFEGNSNELINGCKHLTQNNCKNIDCCVWANNSKCLVGSSTGPTYKTENGKTPIQIDNYYYQNKCYGVNCPISKIKK